MPSRRKATSRDLPALLLLFGVIFAFVALALSFGTNLGIAKRSDLHRVSGTVLSVSRTFVGKAGQKIQIFVRDGGPVHHLTQDDLSYDVPALRSIHSGDNVTALVKSDLLGRDLEWFWELQRDGVAILTYEQTRSFIERERERSLAIARWAGGLSIALLFAAILLRRRFGGWRDTPLSREAVN